MGSSAAAATGVSNIFTLRERDTYPLIQRFHGFSTSTSSSTTTTFTTSSGFLHLLPHKSSAVSPLRLDQYSPDEISMD
ncbi:hypothetical protein Sjap_024141 [Stephania japonica]|uniref:Uncharacterized protein n=1 Tax=Stephania japonica TaxID=461633 RepID=A0AAP0ED14_9MAGN